jgi:hypothetical protein
MKKTGRSTAGPHVLLDLPLAVEVRDARLPMCAADGAVNEVLDAGFLRRVRKQDSLPDLPLDADLPELLDGKYAVHPGEHPLDGSAVLEVPTHDLGPKIHQLLRRRFLGIAGQRAHSETPLQQVSRHRSTLLARGPADQDHSPSVAPTLHTSSFGSMPLATTS